MSREYVASIPKFDIAGANTLLFFSPLPIAPSRFCGSA